MSQTMQDLIDLQSADQNTVTADTDMIAADQVKLGADTATQATDVQKQSDDGNFFQSSLATTGPVAAVVGAQSVVIYAAPGAVIPANTPIPLASSVAVPGS